MKGTHIAKIFTFILALFCYLLLCAQPVDATLKASSTYNVQVKIDTKGNAVVSYTINLVNESDDFFIRDYSLITNHTDLTELSVFENDKRIDFRKEYSDNFIRIKAILANQLVNKGDRTSLIISYKTAQILEKSGKIQMMYIPPFQTEENLVSAKIRVEVPKEYGGVSYNSLKDFEITEEETKNVYAYYYEDAPNGAFMIFGDQQQFDFTYTYALTNNSGGEKRYVITLPPDTPFQNVFFIDSSIIPEKTWRDDEGNNLVEYTLATEEEKIVRITGFTQNAYTYSSLNAADAKQQQFTAESTLWNYSDEQIRNIIETVVGEHNTNYKNARRIYDYLLNNFSYSSSAISERVPMTSILETPDTLSCVNFADGFVSLARGSQIPSRVVAGYVIMPQNYQFLHYWAEFYDETQNKWVSVDPCLEDWLMYDGFDVIGNNRIQLGYWGLNEASPEIIYPFEKIAGQTTEPLVVYPSDYDYSIAEKNIDFAYHVGDVDVVYRMVPLTFTIKNNSRGILAINSVFIDEETHPFASKHQANGFYEAVFSEQETQMTVLITDVKDFSLERIQNHTFTLSGSYAGNVFHQHNEFEITNKITMQKWLMWGLAIILAFFITAIILHIHGDMPKLKFFVYLRKYLRKRFSIFRRRKSVV